MNRPTYEVDQSLFTDRGPIVDQPKERLMTLLYQGKAKCPCPVSAPCGWCEEVTVVLRGLRP